MGTTLGENCIVGAGSVLKGQYPANSVIVQKRNTEVTCYAMNAVNGQEEILK